MENELLPMQQPANTAITPMHMLQMAVSQNADLDKLEKLMALQERYESNEARKAFTKALSEFKAVGVVIGKDKHVKYNSVEYNHATLGNICNIIGAELSKFGLSYRWNTDQNEGKIKVTCVLMHVMGHSESVSLESGADSSGSKNAIQAIGSTVSYLQRYTLLSITGTATQEQDDDGKKFGLGDVMDEGVLCDYLAAIEASDSKKAVASVYLQAIEAASSLADQEAMNRLNTCKDAALAKFAAAK
jgi:hypothetical protein